MKKSITASLLLLQFGLAALAQNQALQVEHYTLANGLSVYLNQDSTANEVYGAVAVKVGSKNDPADATGMAHYLEHMLFKGTTELGTSDYLLEKPHLDSINFYYDQLGKTSGKEERARIQKLINEQSIKASKYGLPTEFDKLIKSIGGTGVNAFTTADMTVYHNSFPGEQMEKWLELYSHRFQNPVFRSFQSELEVVYEEKNRSLDNMQSHLFEKLDKNLFKNHPYGTQTTLGKVEHLKNPSLTKMYEYFKTYYVANNMALVICGNFEPEKIKPQIEKYFSKLKQGKIPAFPNYENSKFEKNEKETVRYTPVKVELIGYKTFANGHEDEVALEVAINMLNNYSETGSLNKLERNHKLMYAEVFNYNYNDDGAVIFLMVPRFVGQSFRKVEKLVQREIDNLIEGKFSDDLLKMVKTELYKDHERSLENYQSRAFQIASSFGSNESWEDYLKYSQEIDKITKEDIQKVAKKYFQANHFTLRSRLGTAPKTVLKKPPYQPVSTDQKAESEFAKDFNANKILPERPRFIDLEKDAHQVELNSSNALYAVSNPINDIFSLQVTFKVGSDSIKNLDLASDLSAYFHLVNQTLDQTKEEFAKLGLSYYSSSGFSSFQIGFTGLEKNLEASLKLINSLIYHPEVDQKVMSIIYDEEKGNRKFDKKDPSTIGDALYSYAFDGSSSFFLDRPALKEIKKIKAQSLLGQYKKAVKYDATWHFVGHTKVDSVVNLIKSNLELENNQKECPRYIREVPKISKNVIYITHDKKAVQSQVQFIVPSKSHQYTASNKAHLKAFNEYMDGDFSGLIMQEIREFRSLAYSAYGSLYLPFTQTNGYFSSYVGCQADKTNEAIRVMKGLLDSMPQKPERIDAIRLGMKNSAAGSYPSFRSISRYIEYSQNYGLYTILTPKEYAAYDLLSFDDILQVYNSFLQDRPYIITISGNTKKMDLEDLGKIGEIKKVKKKELFTK